MFLNENTVLERFVRMDPVGALKFVRTVKKRKLEEIAQKFHIKIEPCIEDDRCGELTLLSTCTCICCFDYVIFVMCTAMPYGFGKLTCRVICACKLYRTVI